MLAALGASRTRVIPAPGATVISQQYWYTYDGENRTVINQGHLYSGKISLQFGDPMVGYGPWYSGYMNLYDAAGNVTAKLEGVTATGGGQITRMLYTERGQLSVTFDAMPMGTYGLTPGTSLPWSVATERRFYDDAGRLTEIRGYFPGSALPVNGSGVGPLFVEVAGWLRHYTTFSYDNDNQVTTQAEYGRIGAHWVDAIMTAYSGNATTALVPQSTNTGVLSLLSTTTTTRNAAGRTSTMVYAQSNVAEGQAPYGVPLSFTHNYAYTDLKRDDYLENTVSGGSTDNNFKASLSSSTYNAYGQRTAIKEDSKAAGVEDQWRYFSYGADGQILSRYDGKWKNGLFDQGYTSNEQKSNRHHFSYVNGQMVGSVDHLGRMEVISQATAFDSGSLGTNQTTVQAGDTLESIAQRVYGNSSYWYVIASANGLHVDSDLSVGMNLKVPDVKTSKNDSSTFKPYNPAEIVGDTTPTLAYIPAPKANLCAMVVMVVIAVALTVVTYGALAKPMALALSPALGAIMSAGAVGAITTAATAFVAGAVGAAVSGAVGSVIGASSFSWRSVASAGVANALTMGIAQGLGGSTAELIAASAKPIKIAASLATSATSNYVANKIAGVADTAFSWKAVAASAVSTYSSAKIGTKWGIPPPKSLGGAGSMAADAANGLIGGVVNLHVRRGFGFDDRVDYGAVAANAVGSALGNALGENWHTRTNSAAADKVGEISDGSRAGVPQVLKISPKGIVEIVNKLSEEKSLDSEATDALVKHLIRPLADSRFRVAFDASYQFSTEQSLDISLAGDSFFFKTNGSFSPAFATRIGELDDDVMRIAALTQVAERLYPDFEYPGNVQLGQMPDLLARDFPLFGMLHRTAGEIEARLSDQAEIGYDGSGSPYSLNKQTHAWESDTESGMNLAMFGASASPGRQGIAGIGALSKVFSRAGQLETALARVERESLIFPDNEIFTVVTESGEIAIQELAPKQGGRPSNALTALLRGKWFTHGHHSDFNLSFDDVVTTLRDGAMGVRARSSRGVHEMKFDIPFEQRGAAALKLIEGWEAFQAATAAKYPPGLMRSLPQATSTMIKREMLDQFIESVPTIIPGARYRFIPRSTLPAPLPPVVAPPSKASASGTPWA